MILTCYAKPKVAYYNGNLSAGWTTSHAEWTMVSNNSSKCQTLHSFLGITRPYLFARSCFQCSRLGKCSVKLYVSFTLLIAPFHSRGWEGETKNGLVLTLLPIQLLVRLGSETWIVKGVQLTKFLRDCCMVPRSISSNLSFSNLVGKVSRSCTQHDRLFFVTFSGLFNLLFPDHGNNKALRTWRHF